MSFECVEQKWFDFENPVENCIINFVENSHTFTEGEQFNYPNGRLFGEGLEKHTEDLGDGDFDIISENKKEGVSLIKHLHFFENVSCVEQYNTVTSLTPQRVQNFTSATFNIPCDGEMPWNDESRFKIHFCRSSWMLEGQWKTVSLSDLGICPIREHSQNAPTNYFWRSEGSWSSGRFYPLVIVEDTFKSRTYFIEHEGGITWEISLSKSGNGCLVLSASSADFHHDGWMIDLDNGESYDTTAALYGYVDGDFEEAVKALTYVKRCQNMRKWAQNVPPVCFNVFMGAIFGEPTDRNLIPLIDAAADVGCEVFCIDAGWYRPELDFKNYGLLGDYIPDKNRFGEMGLQGILDYIKSKNMIPGLWFEFEAVNKITLGGQIPGGMVTRNGITVSCDRGIFDLCNEEVRSHLLNAVDRVYKMGMRYIKNDHNYNSGFGFGEKGENYSLEARKRMDAFYSFIDELYARYPDLIIENCGSGAMREDNGTLCHFHVQSTSDQEMYYNYPPIISGSLALMPPEKAGNWVYPYAVSDGENREILQGKRTLDYIIERYRDGEITTYNMVSAFFGCVFLSGRIDVADEKNKKLIKEALTLYKKKREFIASAWGIFPMGFSYQGKKGFYSVGITDGNRILLGVWKTFAKENSISIDISKYIKSGSTVKCIYPQNCADCFTFDGKALNVTLKAADCTARLFEIII